MSNNKLTVREVKERHSRAVQRARNGVLSKVLSIIKEEIDAAETERASRGAFGASLANNKYIHNIRKRINYLKKEAI